MKKLMIVGLVAFAAATTQASILSNLRAYIAAKYAIGYSAPSYTYTYNVAKTSAVKAGDAVKIIDMTEDELAELMMRTDTKAKRKSLLSRIGTELENWKPKSKVGEAIKKASLGIVEALHKTDVAIKEHWNNYVVPTVRDIWAKIREFFGGKKKESQPIPAEITKKEVVEAERAKAEAVEVQQIKVVDVL